MYYMIHLCYIQSTAKWHGLQWNEQKSAEENSLDFSAAIAFNLHIVHVSMVATQLRKLNAQNKVLKC